MTRDESPAPVSTMDLLGTLFLVGRKTGLDVQSFPIDAERVSIGRNYDCDIRLYFSDVSKLHCEVIFDLLTGQAHLHAHGANGLLHTPPSGSATLYKPPAIIPLNDKDTFVIRKKVFRFEYGSAEEPIRNISLSPESRARALLSARSSPAQLPIRRRASHRLSLVPTGKTFVPSSPANGRRNSSIGLGALGSSKVATGKSLLREELEEEHAGDEQDGNGIPLVDVVNGEEGDLVYLETKEEEEVMGRIELPIYEHAFMTPQQTGKAPLRNTSAVPRTRKTVVSTAIEIEEEHQPISVAAKASETPHSIPLPPSVETPYEAPVARVSPQIALTTPRGPVSLHKALLLRSARKAWENNRSPGLEGAIEAGDVEVRRKSLSPKRKSPKKSLTPMPLANDAEDEEHEEVEEAEDGELQWIHEDGQAEISADDSDSDMDSFEADLSLDIPGQTIITFTPPEDADNDGERGFAEADSENVLEEEGEEEEQNEEQDEVEEEEVSGDMEEVDQEDAAQEAVPGTPAATRSLNKFFTPQPQRNGLNQPRRSLASIGGPPVRFERLPATPRNATGTLLRSAPAPGTLGKPSRRVAIPVREESEVEEFVPVSTPIPLRADPAMLAEAKRRRESLATPRALPVPPASGFKSPVRKTRLSHLLASPTHPALTATSPELVEKGVASTPLNDIKHRLSNMRQQSVQRQEGRRATLGFALPATPADRPRFVQSASFANFGSNTRRFVHGPPATPIVVPHGGSEVFSLTQSPVNAPMPTVSLHDNLPQRLEKGQVDVGARPIDPLIGQARPSGHESPCKEDASAGTPRKRNPSVIKRTAQAKTLYMAGIRNLYPTIPRQQASPSLIGVKDLLLVPVVPTTPSFTGMKSLFAKRPVPPTPAMEGVAEMYHLREESDEEEEKVEEREEIEVAELSAIVVSVPSPVSKPSARSKGSKAVSSASSRSRTPAVEGSQQMETETTQRKAPARRGKAKIAATVVGEASEPSAASKPGRGRRADEPTVTDPEPEAELQKSTSTASRSRRTTTEEPISAPVLTKSTRTSKPSRSSRTQPVEATAEPNSKSSRSAASRSSRTADVPAAVEEADEPKPKGRGKKVFGDSDEQITVAPMPEPTTKTARGKKPLASSTSDEPKSAPSRSTRTAIGDKENEAEGEVEVVEKKTVKRGSAKKLTEPAAVVMGTRTTRSRR